MAITGTDMTAVAPSPKALSNTPLQSRRYSTGLAAEVRDALSRRQRELPSVFLADPGIASVRRLLEARASERLQKVEGPLVKEWSTTHRRAQAIRRVVEFTPSGSASIFSLLDASADQPTVDTYLAVDQSLDPAREGAARVSMRYPNLHSLFVTTDPVPPLPVRRASGTVFAMLGRGIGRYSPVAAIRILRALRAVMSIDDTLLLGIDQRTPEAWEEAAHNDAELLTKWHRHATVVANRDAGTDFDPDSFTFALRYDAETRRIDEGIVNRKARHVAVPLLGSLMLRPKEFVRTSMHCSYAQPMLATMLRGVGLSLRDWRESADGTQALGIVRVQFPDDGMP